MTELRGVPMRLSQHIFRFAVPFLILLPAVPTLAAPSFEAVCEDTHTKAYRTHIYDGGGKQLTTDDSTAGWSEGEKFQGDAWTFQYDPNVSTQFIMIDNNPAMVMDTHDHMLLVIKPNVGPMSEHGMMSYVIHTRLREIVVTDVAGRQGDHNSVKGRVTTLKCKFYLPREYVMDE